jgi:hypothetical protein
MALALPAARRFAADTALSEGAPPKDDEEEEEEGRPPLPSLTSSSSSLPLLPPSSFPRPRLRPAEAWEPPPRASERIAAVKSKTGCAAPAPCEVWAGTDDDDASAPALRPYVRRTAMGSSGVRQMQLVVSE